MKKMEAFDVNQDKYPSGQVAGGSYDSREIQRDTEEWKYVEFLMKSSIKNDISIQKIITLSNEHTKIRFLKQAEDKVSTYAWNYGYMIQDSNFGKFKMNELEIGPNGLDFWTGVLPDDLTEEHSQGLLEGRDIILSKIIIGRAFVKFYKEKQELINFENSQKNLKPPEYDSVLLWNQQEPKKTFTAQKSFKYRIFNSESVLPLYHIILSPKETAPKESGIKFCNECGTLVARFFCTACNADLCEEDYNNIHNPENKFLFGNHTKEKIDPNKPGMCECNNNRECIYYCMECQIPMCDYCKMVGTHSKGISASHELVEIGKLWGEMNPDKNKMVSSMDDCRKIAVKCLNKIVSDAQAMKKTQYESAKKALQEEIDKEMDYAAEVATKYIRKDTMYANYILMIKSITIWLDSYFCEREAFLKPNYFQEYTWIWLYHYYLVNKVLENVQFLNPNFEPLYLNQLKLHSASIFKIIKFILDEGAIDQEEEVIFRDNKGRLSQSGKTRSATQKVKKSNETESSPFNKISPKQVRARQSIQEKNNRHIVTLVSKMLPKNEIECGKVTEDN